MVAEWRGYAIAAAVPFAEVREATCYSDGGTKPRNTVGQRPALARIGESRPLFHDSCSRVLTSNRCHAAARASVGDAQSEFTVDLGDLRSDAARDQLVASCASVAAAVIDVCLQALEADHQVDGAIGKLRMHAVTWRKALPFRGVVLVEATLQEAGEPLALCWYH